MIKRRRESFEMMKSIYQRWIKGDPEILTHVDNLRRDSSYSKIGEEIGQKRLREAIGYLQDCLSVLDQETDDTYNRSNASASLKKIMDKCPVFKRYFDINADSFVVFLLVWRDCGSPDLRGTASTGTPRAPGPAGGSKPSDREPQPSPIVSPVAPAPGLPNGPGPISIWSRWANLMVASFRKCVEICGRVLEAVGVPVKAVIEVIKGLWNSPTGRLMPVFGSVLAIVLILKIVGSPLRPIWLDALFSSIWSEVRPVLESIGIVSVRTSEQAKHEIRTIEKNLVSHQDKIRSAFRNNAIFYRTGNSEIRIETIEAALFELLLDLEEHLENEGGSTKATAKQLIVRHEKQLGFDGDEFDRNYELVVAEFKQLYDCFSLLGGVAQQGRQPPGEPGIQPGTAGDKCLKYNPAPLVLQWHLFDFGDCALDVAAAGDRLVPAAPV